MLIFLDLETTGLDVARDRILEVGVAVVSSNMRVVESRSWVAALPDDFVEEVAPVVDRMHTANGLWDEVGASAFTIPAIEADLEEYLSALVPGRWVMAGSSIQFDRNFLKKWMPNLEKRFHYRMLDVSSLDEAFLCWSAKDLFLGVSSRHRALDDCLASLDKLIYYRTLFERNNLCACAEE